MTKFVRHYVFGIHYRKLLSIQSCLIPKLTNLNGSSWKFYLNTSRTHGQVFHRPYAAFAHTDALGIQERDEDTFGLLAKQQGIKVFHPYHPEVDEIEEDEVAPVPFRDKKSAFAFHYICKKLAKAGKLEECIKTLEVTMLKEQRVYPLEENFSVVMAALAHRGKLDETLRLYYKAKEYGISPASAIYTPLFNAFANCSDPICLKTLKAIYVKAKGKKSVLNRASYHALLKAYAKHDNLQNTMEIFRDCIAAGYEPDLLTFSYLLQSCQEDRENGFRQAIQVWKNMIALGIHPDGRILLLFLTVLKQCNIGDIKLANKVLLHMQTGNLEHFLQQHVRKFRWLKGQQSHPNPRKYDQNVEPKEAITLLGGAIIDDTTDCDIRSDDRDSFSCKLKTNPVSNASAKSITLTGNNFNVQTKINLLTETSTNGIVSILKCPQPSDRLSLIGGLEGVLNIIVHYGIKPTAMLFTKVAECLPDSCTIEDELLNFAADSKINLDVDFYNSIMYRRAKRRNFREAKEIFKLIEHLQIPPNYRTWCVYAMTCTGFNAGKKLIETVKKTEIQPGIVFFTTLVNAALYSRRKRLIDGYNDVFKPDYRYLSFLLCQMEEHHVAANEKLISLLEKAHDWPEGYNRWTVADAKFETEITQFRKVYRCWLEKAECA